MSDKIMSGPKPKNQRSQNAFDLSKNIGFTAKLGEILPLYYFDVSPNDKVKINFNAFTRTVPLNQSGFLSVREHYNAYFVPYRLLYKAMPAWLTQMFDETNIANTMVSQSQIPQGMPMIDVANLISTIHKCKRTQYDDAGMCRPYQVLKLLHYLKYQVDALSTYKSSANNYANIMPLLAYHKIYNDYFRLQQWELPNAATFNCDYFASSPSPLLNYQNFFEHDGSNFEFVSQKTMLDMEYCSYPQDMFTGVVPQQQYGTVSTLTLGSMSENLHDTLDLREGGLHGFSLPSEADHLTTRGALLSPSGPITVAIEQESTNQPITSIHLDPNSQFLTTLKSNLQSLASSIDALQLRQLKAEQRWKEITQLHKKDYKSQIDAHFGKSISPNLSTVCHYIGGMQQDLNLNTVINNNLVDGNADNKAFGTATGKSTCKFTAQEHGIVMIVYNATILPQYETFGLSPVNVKNVPTDFLLPEYDKIGYEEVDSRFLFVNDKFNQTKLGYAPRYYDYKTSFDEYMGGFNRYASDFVANQGKLSTADKGYSGKAAFPGYTASLDFCKYLKPGLISPSGKYAFDYKVFKVRPDLLNDICITQVMTQSQSDSYVWTDAEYTSNTLAGDQFLCRCQIGVTQIETCSRFGLPL